MNPKNKTVHVAEKFTLFTDEWSPKVLAELNDIQFKAVKLSGSFVWHSHEDTDEAFLVMKGTLQIEFRDRVEIIRPGELIIVEKGTDHRPFSDEAVEVLIIEPRGVVNTGDADSDQTAENDVWI